MFCIEDFFNKDTKIITKGGITLSGFIVGREYDLETNDTLGVFVEINNKNEFVLVEDIETIEENI